MTDTVQPRPETRPVSRSLAVESAMLADTSGDSRVGALGWPLSTEYSHS